MKKAIIISICVLLAAAGILWALLSKDGAAPSQETDAALPALNGGGETLPERGDANSSGTEPGAQTPERGEEAPVDSGLPIDWNTERNSAPTEARSSGGSGGAQPQESSRPGSDPGTPPSTQSGGNTEQSTEGTPEPIVPILPPDEFG